MNVKIKRERTNAILPETAHPGDAGYDLVACINGTIYPNQPFRVPVGFSMAIPEGYVGLVCPRSGLASKYSVTVANAPGVIDSQYRGEIEVVLDNFGVNTFFFKEGDKVAQLVIVPCLSASFEVVESLDETKRGTDGFGSTGLATLKTSGEATDPATAVHETPKKKAKSK